MKKTKILWVANRLKRYGSVTRDRCLDEKITRLAAIIPVLRLRGMNIKKGEKLKTKKGCDFIYKLISRA